MQEKSDEFCVIHGAAERSQHERLTYISNYQDQPEHNDIRNMEEAASPSRNVVSQLCKHLSQRYQLLLGKMSKVSARRASVACMSYMFTIHLCHQFHKQA